jgi:hypothetical protein
LVFWLTQLPILNGYHFSTGAQRQFLSLFNVTADLGVLRFVAAKDIDENERGIKGRAAGDTQVNRI